MDFVVTLLHLVTLLLAFGSCTLSRYRKKKTTMSTSNPTQDSTTVDTILNTEMNEVLKEVQGVLLAVCLCMLVILVVNIVTSTIIFIQLRRFRSQTTLAIHRYSNLGTDRHIPGPAPYTALVPERTDSQEGTLLRGPSANESNRYLHVLADDSIITGSTDAQGNGPTATNSANTRLRKPDVLPKSGKCAWLRQVKSYLTPVPDDQGTASPTIKESRGQTSGTGPSLFTKRP